MEELKHRRKLIRVSREELFDIFEQESIRLSEAHVREIMSSLSEGLARGMQMVNTEFLTKAAQFGSSVVAGLANSFQMQVDQAIHLEVIGPVSTRAAALARGRAKAWKNRFAKYGDLAVTNIVTFVVAFVCGWIGALATDWPGGGKPDTCPQCGTEIVVSKP